MHDQDEDKPGVLIWAATAFSLISVGILLFKVATDGSRPYPLLDLVIHIAALALGVVAILTLFAVLAGKAIDDDKAVENAGWSLRVKLALSVFAGVAATFGLL